MESEWKHVPGIWERALALSLARISQNLLLPLPNQRCIHAKPCATRRCVFNETLIKTNSGGMFFTNQQAGSHYRQLLIPDKFKKK